MTHPFVIDGQRQPKPPERPIALLDGAGIDLRLMPQPLVFEQSNFGEYIAAGGDWIDTLPADLA